MKLIIYPPAQFKGQNVLPTGSPFCQKSWCQLKLSGLDYEIQYMADPRKTPMQKLPILEDDGQVIADSAFIQTHLETKYGMDLDAGLSEADKATSHAFIRMMEEHFYFIILADRWMRDANWPSLKDTFFGDPPSHLKDKIVGMAPKFMRGFLAGVVRKSVIKQAKGQGSGRYTTEQQHTRISQDLNALLVQLGDKPYLFGDRPTTADTSIIPMLDAMGTTGAPNILTKAVSENEAIMAYVNRGRASMYVL